MKLIDDLIAQKFALIALRSSLSNKAFWMTMINETQKRTTQEKIRDFGDRGILDASKEEIAELKEWAKDQSIETVLAVEVEVKANLQSREIKRLANTFIAEWQ